ncbi:uncharacterized protein [Penaeus vannamei]|uniref:uncharacterized protein isoform X2 n=1 Tax=Penaeus vannamei TaxID=6689 RepID=UPI00387FADF2
MDPSTSKTFPGDLKDIPTWNQHSEIVEIEHSASSGRPGDITVFPSQNPEQCQSNKPQREQKEPFDLSITNSDQEYTNKSKLDEDHNQKFTERNPHHGHYAQLVTPPSNSTSGEALGLDQNAHTSMTVWSTQNELPLSTTSFLQPHSSSPYDSATAVITSKQNPNIQGDKSSSTNIQNDSLSQPSRLQPTPTETVLDTPLCFPSPSSVSTTEDQMNVSPFGVSPSSCVTTDGSSKNDGEFTMTGADDPSMETECAEMLKMNNGKETNTHFHEFYKDSSSSATSVAIDQHFTNYSCAYYMVPHMDSVPSNSKGYPANVIHDLSWNLQSESVQNNHSTSFGRPGDARVYQSVNPKQCQYKLGEPFDIPIIDHDQEETDKDRFDKDQNLKIPERGPCQDQYALLVTPPSNSTSGEAHGLNQNDHTPVTAWSSQKKLPLQTTFSLQPQQSSLYDSTAIVITSSKEIPNTNQAAYRNSADIQNFLWQPGKPQCETHICFPSPSPVSTTGDQRNTNTHAISPSSYVNAGGISKNDGGCTVTDYDQCGQTSKKQESNREECAEMQRLYDEKEKNDIYSPDFSADSSSFATSAIADQQYTNSSSERYEIPNIDSLSSTSKGFPDSNSGRPDVTGFPLINREKYQSYKHEHEQTEPFDLSINDLDQESINKNKFDGDQNLKLSDYHQDQHAHLVSPPSNATGEALELDQNQHTPMTVWSSWNKLPVSTTSPLQLQPSSPLDSTITEITSKEIPDTIQGTEGTSVNIQSHSLSHQSNLQPAPMETTLGTPLCFPSPSSVTEDQLNTSPFGVSPSSYVDMDGINKDGGLKVSVDNNTSIDASTREESNGEEYNEMQRVIRGKERSDTYSAVFYTNYSSSATSATIDHHFINTSSEGYVPNIGSLPSTSKEFPKDHNLLLHQHSESIEYIHAISFGRSDVTMFHSLNSKQYQSNKPQHEKKEPFDTPIIDCTQEGTNKNQFDKDQNQKFSERAPIHGQNAQLVTPPSSSTSGVITSSEEISDTVQGDEGSSTNIQSHSLCQPIKLQPAPTETVQGIPIRFPSPSSATEDQMNSSPSGVSPSSYVNTDGISKEDGGLTLTGADDASIGTSLRKELNKEGVLEPIQTKILKYKDGRKRMFMVLQRSSFELMKDKGLIQPVKAYPNGQILPVTKDEIESSKTLLPPSHQPEDIEKIQYKSITQLEDLEELPDSMEDIRKLPIPGSYESQHPLRAPQRSFSPFTLEWSDNPFFTPIKQTPVVVTWSATSVSDSPALTFTIQLPSKMNNSSFKLHSATINSKQSNVIPSGASNHYALPPRSMIRPQLSTEIPSTSSQSLALYTNKPPSIVAEDLSQMPDMYPPSPSNFHEWEQDVNHNSSKGSKVLKISDKGIGERQNLVRKNILWLANKEGTSQLREEDVKQLSEKARNHNKDFEATKHQLKRRYSRLLNKHSQKYNGLLKKYRNLERTYNIVEDAGSREQIIRDAKKFLSEEHAMFLESQLFLKNRAGKGNRFSKKFLKYVIGIYERSPAGYRFLRTIFTMPSVRTIHKWQNRSNKNVAKGIVDQDNVMEMSGTYGDIESFADMLQMGPMPSGHEETEVSNPESFQELINIPPPDFYENNGALFWEDSQVGFEVPQQFVQPQEQVVQSGCEVEYIQNVDDAYMLTQL